MTTALDADTQRLLAEVAPFGLLSILALAAVVILARDAIRQFAALSREAINSHIGLRDRCDTERERTRNK